MKSQKQLTMLKMNRVLVTCLLAVLAPFLFLTLHAHPNGDDFYFSTFVARHGVLGSLVDHYFHWSGRLTATLMLTVIPLSFDQMTSYWVVPFTMFLLFPVSLYLLLRYTSLLDPDQMPPSVACLLLSALYVSAAPSIYEALYYNPTVITYQLGILLVILLLGIAGKPAMNTTRTRMVLRTVLCCSLAILAVGTSEPVIVFLLASVSCGLAVSVYAGSRSRYLWMATFVIALLVGAASILAPGNTARALTYSHRLNVVSATYHATILSLRTILEWSSSLSLWAASVLILPAMTRRIRTLFEDRMPGTLLMIVPAIWAGTITVTFLLTYVSSGVPPHPRVQNVSYVVFLMGWFVTGAIILNYLQIRRSIDIAFSKGLGWVATVALMIGLVTTPNVEGALADVPRVEKLSQFLNSRYALIRQETARGTNDVTVPKGKYWFYVLWEDEIRNDPLYWGNRVTAEYFGLRSIKLDK